jgi:hypothetical protein
MATKKFSDYAIEGNNVTLTYDNVNDTVTFDVNVDKNDVGLGNVDNTSDANKPISTATQTALDSKASTTALNSHVNDVNNPHSVTKTQVGLGNVDNTSDLNKPISTATQTALDGKENTITAGTTSQYYRGDKTFQTLDKTAVGLSNVANVDTTNASNISSGTLSDSRLSSNVTLQGNTFNTASKLVQLDATAKLPAVDGSQLTNLPTFSPPNGILRLASAISTTFQAVTDYLSNASVLFLNSRRIGIGKDTSVTTQSVAVVEVQDANASLVLKPNGTGGIIASVPDGTATGGNARGAYAVDLQMLRNNSQNVASGNYSFIGSGYNNRANGGNAVSNGGEANTASSNYSTISGGQSNTASTNTHATVVGGQSNTSSGQKSVSGGNGNTSSGEASVTFGSGNIASARFATGLGMSSRAYLYNQLAVGAVGSSFGFTVGASQYSFLVASGMGVLTTGNTTSITLDGDAGNLIIPNGNNRAWNVQINTISVVTAITGTATGVSVGDTYSEVKNLLFKRIGGTSSIVGTVDTSNIKSDTSMSTALMTITAGASQQMALTFTAPTFSGGGSVTCRVVSKVSLVECAY